MLQRLEQLHLLLADGSRQEGREQLAYAVVVAERGARLRDGVEYARVILLELVEVGALDDEDEVEVGALRIAVRDMGGADGVGPFLDGFAHLLVDGGHVVPVDRALEGVDDDAVVLDGVAHIRIAEPAVFPRGGDIPGEGHGAVLMRDLAHILHDIALQTVLAVREPEQQAAAAGLVALRGEQRVERALGDAVHMHHHVRLLGVRKPEHRRITELALHDLAHGCHAVLPGREHIGELAVFMRELEHFERDFGEYAEGPLAAHHDLVDVGTRRLAGRGIRAYPAHGRDILLTEHEIGGAAVVSGILPAAARHHPAAHAAVLEGLREMPAGETMRRAEILGGVVEDLLEIGTAYARLHGDGLVDLVEGDDLVEVLAQIQDDVGSLHALGAPRDAGTAGVHIEVNAMLL